MKCQTFFIKGAYLLELLLALPEWECFLFKSPITASSILVAFDPSCELTKLEIKVRFLYDQELVRATSTLISNLLLMFYTTLQESTTQSKVELEGYNSTK